MKKKVYRKNIIIVILSLLVVILSGYLVYDNVLLDNNNQMINSDTMMYNIIEMDDYKNYDETYGIVEKLYFDDGINGGKYYYIELDLNGDVYYADYSDVSERKFILRNVVDIVSFTDGAGSIDVVNCYMLDKDGNVYRYKLSDFIDGKMIGEKLNIVNVEKLVHVDWASQENAGGNWAIVAVTKDGDYVELVRAGVQSL